MADILSSAANLLNDKLATLSDGTITLVNYLNIFALFIFLQIFIFGQIALFIWAGAKIYRWLKESRIIPEGKGKRTLSM